MANKITLFLVCLVWPKTFGGLESTIAKQLREKYNFKNTTSYSPVIHWIEQKGCCSWLHALWAQVAKRYWNFSFIQGGSTRTNPDRTGKPGWWEKDLSWLQDINVQMAMMRLLIDQDLSLLKEFLKNQNSTRCFTIVKKVTNACFGYCPINDDLFFQYVKMINDFLKDCSYSEVKNHLSGQFDCPDLYHEVFKAIDQGVTVMLDETFVLADSLEGHKGSLVSFYKEQIGIKPTQWLELITQKIKELCFRVRVEGNHWVLYDLTSKNPGKIDGTWYESRSQKQIPFFKDFQDLTMATFNQIEEAEDNWLEVKKRFSRGQKCAFKISDHSLIWRKADGIVLQLCIDYSTDPEPQCLNKFAMVYLKPAQAADLLKDTTFLFVRKTCPGFSPISLASGQMTEIEVEQSSGFPTSVKLQTSKEQIEFFNKENANKKGPNGELFKPICSKQSFYFSGIIEFLNWAKDFVFVS